MFTGEYPCSRSCSYEDDSDYIAKVLKEKITGTESLLLKVPCLREYWDEVNTYGFTDEPYYSKLRFIFQKNIMDFNVDPSTDLLCKKQLSKINKSEQRKFHGEVAAI